MEIVAIRHGETDMNAQMLIQGCRSDVPLNAKGRKQAYKAGKKLQSYNIDIIITSPLKRAVETAEIIAGSINIDNKSIVKEQRLCERDFGDYENMHVSEIDFKALRRWTDNMPTPNGETIRDVASRVFECMNALLKQYDGLNILFVVHFQTLRAMLWYFNGLPTNADDEQEVFIDNCEVFKFDAGVR